MNIFDTTFKKPTAGGTNPFDEAFSKAAVPTQPVSQPLSILPTKSITANSTPMTSSDTAYRDAAKYLFDPTAQIAYPKMPFTTPEEQKQYPTITGPRITTGTGAIIANFFTSIVEGIPNFIVRTGEALKTLRGNNEPVTLPFNPERIGLKSVDGKTVVPLTQATLERIEQLDKVKPQSPNLNVAQSYFENIFPVIINGFITGDVTKLATRQLLNVTSSSPVLGISSQAIKGMSAQDALLEMGNRVQKSANEIIAKYSTDGTVATLSKQGSKEWVQLMDETVKLGHAFSQTTIPELSAVGKFFDQTALRLNQDVLKLGESTGATIPKFRPASEKLSGYARENPNMAPAGLSTDPIKPVGFAQKEITPVDRLIAEGKIRVKREGNRDVYEYKKGNVWQRARDEDSAVKAVTPVVKQVNYELEQRKVELEIKKDILENHPAQGLGKYADRTGEFKGELSEVGGSGRFSKAGGDSIATEKGFADSEQARESYQDLKKRKEEIKKLSQEIQEMSRTKLSAEGIPMALTAREKAIVSQAQKSPTPIGEEAKSLEEVAEQSLGQVSEPYRQEISSLDKIITDTSTPVKEKVNALDYFRTPDRVLNKIGLDDVAKELRKGYDGYLTELPEHLKVITEWSKEVPKASNVKIFKHLDGQKVELTPTESKVAGEIQQYLKEWAVRLGLPEDNQITHYITHIFELDSVVKEFDEDIASIIKDRVPGNVYDPFLEKRLGKKGYIEDTWRALDAYVKRAVRKANMDPALEQLKRASVHLEDSQLTYVTRLGARINMRPTELDNLLDNTIKQLMGYRFGQRPTAVISGTLRRMVYRGALGLNISSAVKNLTQGVNTFAKLGVRDTLMGYINLMKPGMSKELEASGVLRDSFIQDRALSAVKQTLQKVDKGLWVMFQLAEKINRGSAYFGAKSRAIRKGMTEEQAIEYSKKMVRDTQFHFGSIDTPVAMQGDIMKTLFQFGNFSQKQTEFLIEMAKKKEWAGIIRYIVAAFVIVTTVGKVFNIKAKDFNPLNYFSRFGSPPSLALPIAIFKAVTNMPDQYGKTPTTKAKVKDIINSSKTLVPAGVQIDKTLKGNILGSPAKKKSTASGNPFNNF